MKELVKKQQKHAGFGVRFLAFIIDMVILATVLGVLRRLLFFPPFGRPYGQYLWGNFNLLASTLYSISLWVNWNGQTVGKKALKIKVVSVDKKALDYKTAIIRYIGYFVSSIVFCLGFFWIIWDDEKQGWHDKIAGTYVVKE